MACGVGWRFFRPAGLSAEQTRKVLTTVVFYVFLPALVLDVLWSADIGLQSIEYTFLGVSGILSALLIMWIITRLLKFGKQQTGAILLAASFPNVTYLGLPVLEQTFGSWAKSVVIQLDFFAMSPLVFTVGIMIAKYYGEQENDDKPILFHLITPPFCAAFIAVFLNLNQFSVPIWMSGTLQLLSAAVVPLMLFSLGLALNWKSIRLHNLPYILPIILIKLFLMPLFAMEIVNYLSMSDEHKAAAVLDMAMPSMMLGIVLCDRYKLDSALFAMAVTVTTLLSILTLPYWYSVL
jgi:predicted permease